MSRQSVNAPPLAPATFDRLASRPATGGRAGMLWGRKEIANFLNLAEDAITTLARRPDCPIYTPSGRYFAYAEELSRWLRSKPDKPRKNGEKRD